MIKTQESEISTDFDPISETCLKVYPDQVNVLQAVSQQQYWYVYKEGNKMEESTIQIGPSANCNFFQL